MNLLRIKAVIKDTAVVGNNTLTKCEILPFVKPFYEGNNNTENKEDSKKPYVYLFPFFSVIKRVLEPSFNHEVLLNPIPKFSKNYNTTCILNSKHECSNKANGVSESGSTPKAQELDNLTTCRGGGSAPTTLKNTEPIKLYKAI